MILPKHNFKIFQKVYEMFFFYKKADAPKLQQEIGVISIAKIPSKI